jgi:hypothetical protein
VEAERRQVTVLFTDTVGFTAYSERAFGLLMRAGKASRRSELWGFTLATQIPTSVFWRPISRRLSERRRELIKAFAEAIFRDAGGANDG